MGTKLLIHSQTSAEVWEWIRIIMPTLYWACDNLSKMGLQYIHVTKRGWRHTCVSEICHHDITTQNIFIGKTHLQNCRLSQMVIIVSVHRMLTMITSSNGNIFRVTGPLWGNSPVTGGFPSLRSVTRSVDIISDLNKRWANNRDADSLWRHYNDFRGLPFAWRWWILMGAHRSWLVRNCPYFCCHDTQQWYSVGRLKCPYFDNLSQ